jgi:DUF4097 and DUF4098 domain-containing protein YvlB
MRKSRLFPSLVVSSLLAASMVLVASAPAGAKSTTSSDNVTHWRGAMSADQSLSIKDVSGDIRAESATGDTAEITATKSGPDADHVQVVIHTTSEGVEACVVFDNDRDACGHNRSSHSIHANVDFTVKVPRNVRLHAQTVNGSVEAEDLGANAWAHSVNGSVSVSTAGYAEARSVNGSVRVKMGRADWSGDLELASVNGRVEATVPADFSADVRFSTLNGNVQSDFSYTVAEGTRMGGAGGGTHIQAHIGSGGRTLRMQSVNGNIELRKD